MSCNKNYQKKIHKNLKNQFKNTFKFSNDINNLFFVKKRSLCS